MFTGIVQGMGELVALEEKQDFRRHVIRMPADMLNDLALGASVAHNGCCLTVSAIDANQVAFDLMQETLRVTNLGALRLGDRINLERAARFGDEIGGHAMSGHIYCQATVTEVIRTPDNRTLWFELPANAMKYVLTKGYIGVDGASLTIGAVRERQFCVHLIPETLQRTTLGARTVGERVNIEIDPQTQAIVDTVERVLAAQQSA
ncbi:riboflavin synthase subunit alpha [Paludibacterium purpuratum]|uniref:Riboflavin synthase n=1 Tax=Paludibacterium purpuratum TaxID=1144873 RepID=A0A4R7AZK6_9NEIS|nr:riboflavin synthase subunit alpha [Paludibacterium purpuratum]TDR73875.1 riboflavin synthase alpha chain [Paludibacterium purpuratum]